MPKTSSTCLAILVSNSDLWQTDTDTDRHRASGLWLLPIRVQEGRDASAAQERRARRQPDEQLQACVESAVPVHAFADDTQPYVQCRRDDVTSAVLRLENCIEEVSHWMSANRLKLNADKTELLWA